MAILNLNLNHPPTLSPSSPPPSLTPPSSLPPSPQCHPSVRAS